MTALPTTILPRLGQLVRMLGSPADGECLNAARALGRTLMTQGASLHDLADRIEHDPAPIVIYRDRPYSSSSSAPTWANTGRVTVKAVLQAALVKDALTAWEREFATSILAQIVALWSWAPSLKQQAHLDVLLAKLHAAGVRP